jgi:pimeloyl-ACP methyl ester carboxylesterase
MASPLADEPLAALGRGAAITGMALTAGLAAVALGILVYVAGSFLMMRSHVTPRPAGRALREALREIGWATITQPLVPLYYFFGRRLSAPSSAATGTPVVVVHGYTQNRVNFLAIARACVRASIGPVYGINYPWFASIHDNAVRLARFVERVLRETGAPQVDLVAHSLGGLVAMEYLATAGKGHVRRLVTIASPHAGVPWRGPILGAAGSAMRAGSPFLVERADQPIAVPCLNLYSSHDNIVHPPRTSELAHRGGRDRAIEHVGHLTILFDRQVVDAVVDFLRAP